MTSEIDDGLYRMLYKAGGPITHAFIGNVDTSEYEGLCGYIGHNDTWHTTKGLKDVFTGVERDVDCPDCKNHKFFELWSLSQTEIE